jgi:hypothetical protein
MPNFHVSDDAVVFSEIVEFALSVAPPSKGQEAFNGLPHLQAYKFVRAASLAEMGHMLAATRLVSQPFFTEKGLNTQFSGIARQSLHVWTGHIPCLTLRFLSS